MFKIDERVYFLKDNRIQSGLVLGWQQSVVKNKATHLVYLIGDKISGNTAATDYFYSESYETLPEYCVFESIAALNKFHETLYQESQGIHTQPFG
jgi:hypothetical protein